MFIHVNRMAMRALLKYKFNTAISLLSMVFGLICFVTAGVISTYLNSFDAHFPNARNTYHLVQYSEALNQSESGSPIVGQPVASYLRAEFPNVEHIVRATSVMPVEISMDETVDTLNIRYVEKGFFSVFPIPILSGGIAVQSDLPPNSVLITEKAANRKYGTTDVIGKSLTLANQIEVNIVGVTKQVDQPSHIESAIPAASSDLIAPIEIYEKMKGTSGDQWGEQSYFTYLQFAPSTDVDVQVFQEQLDAFAERVVPLLMGEKVTYSIRPINQLATSLMKQLFGGINIHVFLFFAGCLVLAIGTLNYSNLAVAQLSLRTKEIGIQKTMGASRVQLVLQYCYETLVLIGFATLVSILLIFNGLELLIDAGIPGVSVDILLNLTLWINIAVVAMVIVLCTGLYPVMRTLNVPLVKLLYSKGAMKHSGRLRSLLVGTQFMISGTLIIFLLIMISQNSGLVRGLEIGETFPRIVIKVPLDTLEIEPDLLAAEFEQHPGILGTTVVDRLPWSLGTHAVGLSTTPETSEAQGFMVNSRVGYGFENALDVRIIAGRTFSREVSNDRLPYGDGITTGTGPYSVIIDKTAMNSLGWLQESEALGQILYMGGKSTQIQVIGIVESPQFQLIDWANMGARGNVYTLEPDAAQFMIVKLAKQNLPASLEHIDSVWKSLVPQVAMSRTFTDELFGQAYGLASRLSNLLAVIAVTGFVIASVGLFGNATFITNMRQKEIGIRKVFGASPALLLRMLLVDFAKPIIIANLIAWPLGFILGKAYISFFAIQTSISFLPFLASLAISTIVVCLAVGYQSIRSAHERPQKVLRYD